MKTRTAQIAIFIFHYLSSHRFMRLVVTVTFIWFHLKLGINTRFIHSPHCHPSSYFPDRGVPPPSVLAISFCLSFPPHNFKKATQHQQGQKYFPSFYASSQVLKESVSSCLCHLPSPLIRHKIWERKDSTIKLCVQIILQLNLKNVSEKITFYKTDWVHKLHMFWNNFKLLMFFKKNSLIKPWGTVCPTQS